MIRDRTGRQGFQFIMRDAELSLLKFLHQELLANAEYRRRFYDHIRMHFYNNGVFTPRAAIGLFRARASEIDRAILGESARWGDAQRPDSPLTHRDWKAAVDRVTRRYMPARTRIVLDQFRAEGLLPRLQPSRFRVPASPSWRPDRFPGARAD